MKNQVENLGNMGVSGAGEGAFSPTPNELAHLKEKLEKEIRNELESMKNLSRAVESLEFANRIEKAALRVLKEFGISNVDVEYSFDEYPTIAKTYIKTNDTRWEDTLNIDMLRIINKETKETLLEIIIHYEADMLEVKSRYYIKLNEVKEINIEMVRE